MNYRLHLFSFHTSGNMKWSRFARIHPSFQVSVVGEPRILQILYSWSSSFDPGKRGDNDISSAIIQPHAQRSTAELYRLDRRRISGALYHRVEIYSVYGGRLFVSRAKPKSAILILLSSSSSKFSGFRSRWTTPCL